MKKTLRFERRLAAAQENAIEVMETYKQEIELLRMRRDASGNTFVKTCCQQDIDQLTAEKRAIEDQLIG